MRDSWNVEIKQFGLWESVGTFYSEIEAINFARQLISDTREEWVRILGPNNKEL